MFPFHVFGQQKDLLVPKLFIFSCLIVNSVFAIVEQYQIYCCGGFPGPTVESLNHTSV